MRAKSKTLVAAFAAFALTRKVVWARVAAVIVLGCLESRVQADTVYAWGRDSWGQYAAGSTVRGIPAPVGGLSADVSTVAAGASYSLALQHGAVFGWGDNRYGQLGDGTKLDRFIPIPVIGMSSHVTAIAGGGGHSLAIKDGALYAWGWNLDGQLGDGTMFDRPTPIAVIGMQSGVTAVAGGNSHSLAIRNGAVYAWGSNVDGQLGDGGFRDRSIPGAVDGPVSTNVTAVAAGFYFSLALRDGALYAWGDNLDGQLGDGTYTDRHSPVAVAVLTDGVTAIAAGGHHTLAIRNGLVYAWGEYRYGQLGDDGFTHANRATPALVGGLSDVVAIAATADASFALEANGTLWAWGGNEVGQLGLGDKSTRWSPTEIPAPTGYKFASIDGDEDAYQAVATIVPVPEPSGVVVLVAFAALASLAHRRTWRRL